MSDDFFLLVAWLTALFGILALAAWVGDWLDAHWRE
jgi:hypothetical protein